MTVFILKYFFLGFILRQLCSLTIRVKKQNKVRSKLDQHLNFLNEFSSFLISVMENFGPCTYVLVLYRQLIFMGIF